MKKGKGFLRVCCMLFLLCGVMTLGALAANVQLDLTYTGVPAGTAGVTNGSKVNTGYVALLEDGVQVNVGGNALTPISGGSVTVSYAFNTASTYELAVQEGTKDPYYKAKTIPIPSAMLSSGGTITETVDWVEWGKPLKVRVEDRSGNPCPVGTEVTVVATDADPVMPLYQAVEYTKPTDSSGEAVFKDLSYDPTDPSMCNIFDNRFFVVAKCGDTTVAQFYQLSTSNTVTLTWPTAEVSGTVYDGTGNPLANQRVASYSDLMSLGDTMAAFDKSWGAGSGYRNLLHLPLRGCVYYTTTDAGGNYTLMLPEGGSADICIDDAGYMPPDVLDTGSIGWYQNAVNRDYADKLFAHFTWARWLLEKDDTMQFYIFQGLKCQEDTTLTCTPVGKVSNMNLTKGRTEYTLKGKLLDEGDDYTGDISLQMISGGPAIPTGMHPGGAITETAIENYAVTDGVINKTDVKLVPGTYTLRAFPAKTGYSDYEPVTVTISAGDVATKGEVNWGSIPLKAEPEPPAHFSGGNIGKPGHGSSGGSGTPGTGHSYFLTRMDKVSDPAYGSNAYQVTLSYTGFHTGVDVNQASGTLEVRLPAGISVNHAGGMSASGSSASGITLTQSVTVPTGKPQSIVFSIKVEPTSPANYYVLRCYSNPGQSGSGPECSSVLTLQRLQINLNAPRLVPAATSFTVFGDITGAGEDSGVELKEVGGSVPQLIATGAKKGRYYYFDVPGKPVGAFTFLAETDRDGTTERSNTVDVKVGVGVPEVKDVYVEAAGMRYNKDPRFNMVNYTAFVNPADLQGTAFDIYVDLANVTGSDTVKVQLLGRDYTAALDSATGYWKATVSGYAGYGDNNIMLDINGESTQIGRLMLLF